MLLNCGPGEDSWESLGLQEDQTCQSWRKLSFNIHWKDGSWSSNTLATWCEELTHWKRLWCWERLKAGGEGVTGWNGWMASPTQWTWVCANSGSWWRTGKPVVLQFMGLQRVGHSWVTEQQMAFKNAHQYENNSSKAHPPYKLFCCYTEGLWGPCSPWEPSITSPALWHSMVWTLRQQHQICSLIKK